MSDYYPYPKRDPIKNYFPLPNEIFLLGLTPGELAVYSYLMRCEDRKTHQCHPSYRTIGKFVHLSPNTVAKHVNGLREKRLITTENTRLSPSAARSETGLSSIRSARWRKHSGTSTSSRCSSSKQSKTRRRSEKSSPSSTANGSEQARVENQAGERGGAVNRHRPRFTADGNADRTRLSGTFRHDDFTVPYLRRWCRNTVP